MEHKGTQILQTERLILRPFAREDAPAAYRNWASDSEVTRYLTWPAHGSPDISEMVIGSWVNSNPDPRFYQWAIVLREVGEPIGSISVVEIDDNVEELEIGYCIGRPWWHQGITSEAFSAVIGYLFRQVGANRICAEHDAANPNSGLVMRKCGLQYEGTLRRHGRNNQGIVDMCMYSILRQEWEQMYPGT